MKNFQSLESLRAWMAWWVVLGHALHLTGIGGGGAPWFLAWLPYGVLQILMQGHTAVNIFIILSGFVITHLLLRKSEPYGPYIARRFLRLFPIFAFCILLAILVTPLYKLAYVDNLFVVGREMRIARFASELEHFWTHIGLHITMLHGLVPDTILPYSSTAFLAPAWSLSLEWQFYLIAPALIAIFIRGRLLVVATTVIVLVLLRVFFHKQTLFQWQYEGFFFLSASYFLIGILCRLVLEKLENGDSFFEYLLLAFIVMITSSGLAALIWAVWFGILLYEAGHMKLESSLLRRAVDLIAFNERIERLGRYSYSTYLVHIPVFSILVGVYAMFVGAENMRQEVVALILVVSFPLIAGVSAILYRYIETPPIRLGKKLFSANAGQGKAKL